MSRILLQPASGKEATEHYQDTIEEVKNPFKAASYLAEYLGKDGKFQKARFSQNWVFPYWWDFGKRLDV